MQNIQNIYTAIDSEEPITWENIAGYNSVMSSRTVQIKCESTKDIIYNNASPLQKYTTRSDYRKWGYDMDYSGFQ